MSIVPSPHDLPVFNHAGKSIYESLILSESVKVPSEARKLIYDGNVHTVSNFELAEETSTRIEHINYRLKAGEVIRVGKRKFIKIE